MYDFDQVPDRRFSNSMKWSTAHNRLTPAQAACDPLPMWVADMDFRVAEPIIQALREAVDFGVYGYGLVSPSFVEAVIDWQHRRFGWKPQAQWLVNTPGIVNAINMAIQAFSVPGDHVLIQTPVYVHFHYDVTINGRRLAEAPLSFDGERYHFDAKRFEAAIKPGTKLFILCHPHNPTGNVWSREDLLAMAQICARHGIIVVSDEVHQDLVWDPALKHIPFASVSEEAAAISVVCTAPSKTFNMAGLQCSNIFIPDPQLRAAFRAQCERAGINLVNVMGLAACEAAYRHCEGWLDALLPYLAGNQKRFAELINNADVPMRVVPTGALYLAWIDCRAMTAKGHDLHDQILRNARLWLDPGPKFGLGGDGFMRINLACPRQQVEEAAQRLLGLFD
ncbi:MalY/PatB family protein [Pseudomonas putida]|uniref:MalY/PatB family protein n=1 Tax=Pseudomonas putida TaxID=303 RepID=UPI00383ABF74